MLLDQIPGLNRAVARAAQREDEIRRRAFLPPIAQICGIAVHPFTPRHFLHLDEAHSPFLYGRTAGPLEVIQFLWIVSTAFALPCYQLPARTALARRKAFVCSPALARLKYERAVREIDRYLDEALFDRPSGSSSDRPSFCFAAQLVDDIAVEYSWLDEVLDAEGQPIHGRGILDMSFARLCQYRRAIRLRYNPDAGMPNRLSDAAENAAISRWEAREAQRAGRATKKGARK